MAESIPSTTDTHHHVTTQDPDIDRDLGVADPVLALGHVNHRKLRRARAFLHDVANLKAKSDRFFNLIKIIFSLLTLIAPVRFLQHL